MHFTTLSYNRKFSLLFFSLACTIIFSACEKVISLDLKTSNSQLVITGSVTDQPGVDTVTLALTGSYFTPGNYPKVNDALVIISDNTGQIDTLLQVDNGKYATTHLLGLPGNTYTLKVTANGHQYHAVSTMPLPVNIDSVYLQPNNGGTDTSYRVRCFFSDPPGLGNFYKGQLLVNGHLLDEADNISFAQDKFTDGTLMNMRLRGYDTHAGDTITVNLQCIDGDIYNYFSVIRTNTGNGNPISTAVPQNPPSNIVGGAIGYFSAYPVRTKTIIVH